MEFLREDNLKGMKLIYILIFLTPLQTSPLKGRGFKIVLLNLFLIISGNVLCAQTYAVNDSIYPAKTVLRVGDTLKMVFNAKSGVMRLSADGACIGRPMAICQFKKPAGWAQIFAPPQMDCGMPYIDMANGTFPLYPQMRTGTYRMVYFTADGKPIETDEFRVVE